MTGAVGVAAGGHVIGVRGTEEAVAAGVAGATGTVAEGFTGMDVMGARTLRGARRGVRGRIGVSLWVGAGRAVLAGAEVRGGPDAMEAGCVSADRRLGVEVSIGSA